MIKNFAIFFTKDYDDETICISQGGSYSVTIYINGPERLPYLQLSCLLKGRTQKPRPANELPC